MNANIKEIRAEINGRMGGIEERLVWVESGKLLQIENEEIRRESMKSTTITLGKTHEICYFPLNQTRNFQQHTFQIFQANLHHISILNYIIIHKRIDLLWTTKFDTKLHFDTHQMLLT